MTLTDEICSAWQAKDSMDSLLTRLVFETSSRASGCWRLKDSCLILTGFGWASDMPHDVSDGFQAATRRVPLDQTGLGIVKAVVTRQPAIGRRDAKDNGLDGSASWIAKFEANSSLAVPIHDVVTDCISGVIAISTAAHIREGDALWRGMIQLSHELGNAQYRSRP